MHTFKGETCRIHYNSDMSGEIIINPYSSRDLEIRVDCQDILDFAAEYIKNKRISEIEKMSTQELLR